MDRTDEKRDIAPTPEGSPSDERGRSDEHVRDEENESPTRRRGHDHSAGRGAREVQRTPGATGIDMGAGGSGTDVDRDI